MLRPAAINVRRSSPGHPNPRFLDRPRLLDPGHPAARIPLRTLPVFVCPQFSLRAFPNPILHRPTDFVPLDPLLATGLVRARTEPHRQRKWWSNLPPVDTAPVDGTWDAIERAKSITARHLADAYLAALAKRGRHNVSLLFHTSKKATSKSCVIRRRLRSKMTTAIDLVVSRNADAVPPPESRKPAPYPPLVMVSRPLEPIVLQGWTYLVTPDLAIYKMPLPNLVQVVRKAFLSLSQQSKRLEASWSSLPKRTPPPSPQSTTRTSAHRRFHRASEHARGSVNEPAKPDSIPIRLYSDRPVLLSHDRVRK